MTADVTSGTSDGNARGSASRGAPVTPEGARWGYCEHGIRAVECPQPHPITPPEGARAEALRRILVGSSTAYNDKPLEELVDLAIAEIRKLRIAALSRAAQGAPPPLEEDNVRAQYEALRQRVATPEPQARPLGAPIGDDPREAVLRQIALSGVEFEDERVGYVSVQIDRDTWLELRRCFTPSASEAP